MKKKSIGLWVVIITVLILGLGAAGGYLYFFTDMLKKPQELFWKYIAHQEAISQIFENEYDKEQSTTFKNVSYVSSGSLTTILEKGTEIQNINVTTATRHDNATRRTYAEANLKNGQDNLLSFSYINSGNIYAIKCEDLLKYYIGIRNENLKKLASDLSGNNQLEKIIPEKIEFSNEPLITEEEQKQLINDFLNIVKQNIKQENYSKAKNNIDINGTTYSANIYTLKLDENQVNQIIITCIDNFSKNQTLLNILKRLGISSEVELSSTAQELKEKINVKSPLTITVYEKDKVTLRTVINTTIEDMTDNNLNTNAIKEKQEVEIIINNKFSENNLNLEIIFNVVNNSEGKQGAKLVLSKVKDEKNITNKYELIPDITTNEIMYSEETKIGRPVNGGVTNTSTTKINNNGKKITATYNKNINKVDTVEEITELKNNNAIIINNYKPEQLLAVLEKSVLNKTGKVVEKLNQSVNIENIEELASICTTSLHSMISANGKENEKKIIKNTIEFFMKNVYGHISELSNNMSQDNNVIIP